MSAGANAAAANAASASAVILSGLPATEFHERVTAFLDGLESGALRAAWPDPSAPAGWRVEAWVKETILAILSRSPNVDWLGDPPGRLPYRDRAALLPLPRLPEGVRVAPGGSAVRRGAHLSRGVVVMPPAYVNVGAFVDEGALIDSHALVGSCAHIGKRVHVSAAAQIGGVLEPAGAMPVIVEDEAFIGGGCGLYEGVVIGRRAVLAAGVILTASSRVFDCVREEMLAARPEAGLPLVIPPGAVVVMGSRPARGAWATAQGLQVATPLIVKRRDESTDARTALAEVLRS